MIAEKQERFLWKTVDQYDDIFSWGIDDGIDMFIDDVVNEPNDTRNRMIQDMQKFIDMYYPEKKLKFYYKEIVIDLKEMKITRE